MWCPYPQTIGNGTLTLGKRTRFIQHTTMGYCTLPRTDQINIGKRFRETANLECPHYQKHYHQSNTAMLWIGTSYGVLTVHSLHGGVLTDARYQNEISVACIGIYAGATGNNFIMMDDNACPSQAFVPDYLERYGKGRKEYG